MGGMSNVSVDAVGILESKTRQRLTSGDYSWSYGNPALEAQTVSGRYMRRVRHCAYATRTG
jgi:hypothetical protein